MESARWPRKTGFHHIIKEHVKNILGPVHEHTHVSGSFPFFGKKEKVLPRVHYIGTTDTSLNSPG